MDNIFVPYKEAVALKKMGFDVPCIAHYNNIKAIEIHGKVYTNNKILDWPAAPTFEQAFKWAREIKHYVVCCERDGGWWAFFIKDVSNEDEEGAVLVEIK